MSDASTPALNYWLAMGALDHATVGTKGLSWETFLIDCALARGERRPRAEAKA